MYIFKNVSLKSVGHQEVPCDIHTQSQIYILICSIDKYNMYIKSWLDFNIFSTEIWVKNCIFPKKNHKNFFQSTMCHPELIQSNV